MTVVRKENIGIREMDRLNGAVGSMVTVNTFWHGIQIREKGTLTGVKYFAHIELRRPNGKQVEIPFVADMGIRSIFVGTGQPSLYVNRLVDKDYGLTPSDVKGVGQAYGNTPSEARIRNCRVASFGAQAAAAQGPIKKYAPAFFEGQLPEVKAAKRRYEQGILGNVFRW